tara:strand:+ start:527 stop:976 length:450 start_codon:yes stop_codon:yes gene_type:complete
MSNLQSICEQELEALNDERSTMQRELNYHLISWRDGLSSIDDDLLIESLTISIDALDKTIEDFITNWRPLVDEILTTESDDGLSLRDLYDTAEEALTDHFAYERKLHLSSHKFNRINKLYAGSEDEEDKAEYDTMMDYSGGIGTFGRYA